jgi:PKHD-type hydroxylase
MLEMNEIEKRAGGYGVIWEDLLNEFEVQSIHKLAENYNKVRATILVENSTARKSNAKWIGYDEKSKWLYDKVTNAVKEINAELFQFELSGAQPFQYTIYDSTEEGEYDWHNDTMSTENDGVRKLSVVILLSDKNEFSGGSFLISPAGGKPKEILMKMGRMVVFPSWIPHCVTPVLEGKRISLVMWLYGKRFK